MLQSHSGLHGVLRVLEYGPQGAGEVLPVEGPAAGHVPLARRGSVPDAGLYAAVRATMVLQEKSKGLICRWSGHSRELRRHSNLAPKVLFSSLFRLALLSSLTALEAEPSSANMAWKKKQGKAGLALSFMHFGSCQVANLKILLNVESVGAAKYGEGNGIDHYDAVRVLKGIGQLTWSHDCPSANASDESYEKMEGRLLFLISKQNWENSMKNSSWDENSLSSMLCLLLNDLVSVVLNKHQVSKENAFGLSF